MDKKPKESLHTRIWREEPEPDNPFATQAAYCHGYDVYGDMLGQARWAQMLYLLFRGEAPSAVQADMLDALAVALANPGPRDPSVHAAMCGGVAGSTAAASLMAALSVGAGRYGGARDVFDAMTIWYTCGNDFPRWVRQAADFASPPLDIWPQAEHPAGFDPHGVSTPTVVVQTLTRLADLGRTPHLTWLAANRQALELALGLPLAMGGMAAAALVDLGFNAKEGEMLYLLLRLPGAAVHALEQEKYGVKKFPFYPVELTDDPLLKEAR
ncbi:MAG: citryl-CoA lyase [Burkholderiales bacterium RIFCSPLOWO2_12_FULL_61_40]|nr:MAG: citryl-CoA lyase [Burkholderiales bacterium RIFCSPLOWO2_12_FULL_61_40]